MERGKEQRVKVSTYLSEDVENNENANQVSN
jgi:hypothetical protein